MSETQARGLSPGKQADLVVLEGGDIRKVKLVFKGGSGYDPAKLLESVRGSVALH